MLLAARCPHCRRPVRRVCPSCWPAVAAVSGPVEFADIGRDLVLGLKYANARSLVKPFAERMASEVRALDLEAVDIVTWAPTSGGRRRKRGYDQAELLAREVARCLGVPCRSLLRRIEGRRQQTGLSRLDRLRGPEFRSRSLRRPVHVLVVDDVITTGATLAAAEQAIRAAGARRVSTVAAAATPRRVGTIASRRPDPARLGR